MTDDTDPDPGRDGGGEVVCVFECPKCGSTALIPANALFLNLATGRMPECDDCGRVATEADHVTCREFDGVGIIRRSGGSNGGDSPWLTE